MGSLNQYLNTLYFDIARNSSEIISMDISADIGQGSIYQIKTKQGVAISDWRMKCHADVNVQGVNGSEYMQIIFCLNEGIAWESAGKNRLMDVTTGESCIYRHTDKAEHICYPKNRDFRFKSMKIPVKYLKNILEEYFDPREQSLIERKLYTEFSKTRITAHMERVLIEMADTARCIGGLGHLYLESKSLELISVYLSELLNLSNAQKNITLSKSDREAIVEVKRIIDRNISNPPSCASLCRMVYMSESKLTRGFKALFGMPVHTYVIDKRLETALFLFENGAASVSNVASVIGYGNASHFAAAFKKKYGVNPGEYIKKTPMNK